MSAPPADRPAEAVDRSAMRGVSGMVAGMTLFVASETVFFAVFFGVYATAYTSARVWPPPGVTPPELLLPSLGIGALLASGVLMGRAVRAVRTSEARVHPWLAGTLAGAVLFAATLVTGSGGLLSGMGPGIYGSLFYVIIGLELAHVAGGAVLIGLVLSRGRGELALRPDPVRAAAIYWYFVVALGVVVYLVLYLAAGGM